MFFVVFSIYKK